MAREEVEEEGFPPGRSAFQESGGSRGADAALFREKIERPEWLEEAEALFLEKASRRYGPLTNVASAASERLHAELWECAESVSSAPRRPRRNGAFLPGCEDRRGDARRRLGELEESGKRRERTPRTEDVSSPAQGRPVFSGAYRLRKSFLVALLSFLPPVKKKREAADRAFLLGGHRCESADREKIREALARQKRRPRRGVGGGSETERAHEALVAGGELVESCVCASLADQASTPKTSR